MARKLSVLFAAAECSPFAKVGGLGDVIGSLPQALAKCGLRVSVILPRYGFIDKKKYQLRALGTVPILHNGKKESVRVFTRRLPRNPVAYYFIDHPFFYGSSIYAKKDRIRAERDAYSRSHIDVERFSLFSQAVVETVHVLPLRAEIIHCHDWHTALIPSFIDQTAVSANRPFIKTIFTIHNLANQGRMPRDYAAHIALMKESSPALLEDFYDLDDSILNAMKIGILSADIVSTVSPGYAKEILTNEYGAGLEPFLVRRKKDLYGILNGIDTKLFNPATDRYIARCFSEAHWRRGKKQNKAALQRELGLPEKNVPVYGLVSRLVAQKGFDILLPALKTFLANDVQVTILGAGERSYEARLTALVRRFPQKISVMIDFDLSRAQRIYAGSDFFLLPSHFEPCGLGQMIAMRYGAIPIARAVGGLRDSIEHRKTGILFKGYTPDALARALKLSLQLFGDAKSCYTMVRRAMKKDFSWNVSAKAYVTLYKKLL